MIRGLIQSHELHFEQQVRWLAWRDLREQLRLRTSFDLKLKIIMKLKNKYLDLKMENKISYLSLYKELRSVFNPEDSLQNTIIASIKKNKEYSQKLIDSVCLSGRVIKLCLDDLKKVIKDEDDIFINDLLVRAKSYVSYYVGSNTVEAFILDIKGEWEDGSS